MKFDLEEMLRNTLLDKQESVKRESLTGSLDNILTGKYIDQSRSVFYQESRFSLPISAGDKELEEFRVSGVVLEWAEMQAVTREDYLFLDTETTGLSSGTGTWVFLTGLGYFEGDEFVVLQYFLSELGGEEVYLSELERVFSNFRLLVSFNGRSYDVNLLRTRFLMNGIKPDFLDKANIDLLFLSRRLWKKDLMNCRLQTIESEIMGMERMEDDELPSSEIPQRYFEYLESGDFYYILKIFKHNLQDIKSLPVLLQVISDRIEMIYGKDNSNEGIAKLLIEQKNFEMAKKCLHAGLESGNSLYCKFELARIYKREGNFDAALNIWESEIESNPDCIEEMAKYFEHKEKDITKALDFTERGIELLLSKKISAGSKILQWQKRKARLEKKLENHEKRKD